jgi:hypothetical protein
MPADPPEESRDRSIASPIVFREDVRHPITAIPPLRWAIATLAAACVLLALPATSLAVTGGTGVGPVGTGGGGGGTYQPPGHTPFDRQGMWIWYVSSSEGGSLKQIARRAHSSGVGTVYVKSGDAGSTWSQFNRHLVRRLHKAKLDVCAWQFVYGDRPLAEAKVGAASVARGADCLVIDAEADYEGKYAAADLYIRALRKRIGAHFPVSLAGFPYVDYHPGYPYSVFLGPGGAQYNQPQMYWKAIGTSVREVYEHTYLYNRVWERPLYPIGQTYDNPGRRQIKAFRRFALNYGGRPPSWWSWQETDPREWTTLGSPSSGPVINYRPVTTNPVLKRGSRGDLVVWAQEHLVSAGHKHLPITGIFGPKTYAAVRSVQHKHGLRAVGVIGSHTWRVLLRYRPLRMHWSGGPKNRVLGSAADSSQTPKAPLSADLPAKAYEIGSGPRP